MKREKEAVIYAVDEADETWYVLVREGEPPVAASWPKMLEDLCPTAVLGGTLGSYDPSHRISRVNGHLDNYLLRVQLYGPQGGGVRVWEQN